MVGPKSLRDIYSSPLSALDHGEAHVGVLGEPEVCRQRVHRLAAWNILSDCHSSRKPWKIELWPCKTNRGHREIMDVRGEPTVDLSWPGTLLFVLFQVNAEDSMRPLVYDLDGLDSTLVYLFRVNHPV